MRIALVTWTDRRAGGVETYVESMVSALAALGHDVALWHETSDPPGRAPMALPPGVPLLPLAGDAFTAMAWKPDALVVNGLQDSVLEASLVDAVPSLVVAHNLNQTCISGRKAWSAPVATPCHRPLGWPCLLHYFPHRCGGLSPVTMMRLYRTKQTGLARTRRARCVVTLSAFMREEYVRHGFEPSRVVCVPFGPAAPAGGARQRTRDRGAPRSLVVIGRLERLKGVHLLIDALPLALEQVGRPMALTIIGDGPEQPRLKAQARTLTAREPRLSVTFTGWVTPADRDGHLHGADLLVMPSVLPEALGLVGMEAARLGVPAAAFDVGGIRQWLIDGTTGVLAPADPPTAAGLARALATCLCDDETLDRLAAHASAHASAFSPASHARGLVNLLQTPQPPAVVAGRTA